MLLGRLFFSFTCIAGLCTSFVQATGRDPCSDNIAKTFVSKFDPWGEDLYTPLGANSSMSFKEIEAQYKLAVSIFEEKLKDKNLSKKVRGHFELALQNIHEAFARYKRLYEQLQLQAFDPSAETEGSEAGEGGVPTETELGDPSWVTIDAFDFEYWKNLRAEEDAAEFWRDEGGVRDAKLAGLSQYLTYRMFVKRGPRGKSTHVLVVGEKPEDARGFGSVALTVQAGVEILDRAQGVILSYPASTGSSVKAYEVHALMNFLGKQGFPFVGYKPQFKAGSSIIQNTGSTFVDVADLAFRLLPILSLLLPKALGASNEAAVLIAAGTFGVAFLAFPTLRAFKFRSIDTVMNEARQGSWLDRALRWWQRRRTLRALSRTERSPHIFSEENPLVLITGSVEADEIAASLNRRGYYRDSSFSFNFSPDGHR